MGIAVPTTTGDPGSGPRTGRPTAPDGPGRVVVVDPPTVAATRAALEAVAADPVPVRVVGSADLTSPHLVDLLADLRSLPGGDRLWALAVPWPATGATWVDDVAVRRGLACLHEGNLALWLDGEGPVDVVAAIARVEPRLVVVHDHRPPPATH